jgi:hypothetical protein
MVGYEGVPAINQQIESIAKSKSNKESFRLLPSGEGGVQSREFHTSACLSNNEIKKLKRKEGKHNYLFSAIFFQVICR